MEGIGLKKKMNNVGEDLEKTSYLQCCILEKFRKKLVNIQQKFSKILANFVKNQEKVQQFLTKIFEIR